MYRKQNWGCHGTTFLPHREGQLWAQADRERGAKRSDKMKSALKTSIELWIQPCPNCPGMSWIQKVISSPFHLSRCKLEKGRHARMRGALGAQQGLELSSKTKGDREGKQSFNSMWYHLCHPPTTLPRDFVLVVYLSDYPAICRAMY